MIKLNSVAIIALLLVGLPMLSFAQPKMGNYATNWYIDYVGERILINSPTSIKGPVTFTISNNADSVGDWGKAIKQLTSPIVSSDIVKAVPYEACSPLTNGSAINGKVALVKRGNCEFGAKAKAAQDAGAVAVIIVNNISGPPVGMGAGAVGSQVTIPVIMVSDVDGAAIEAELGNGAKISMSTWGTGYANDIGFVDKGLGLSHAYSIPLQQIKNTSSLPLRNVDGAVIANYGSNAMPNVRLKATLSWTPTGGSTTVVREDSVVATSNFLPGDSILTPFIDNSYTLNPSGTGRYDVKYEILTGNTDDFPEDNVKTYSFYIQDRLYSKGQYDFTAGYPKTSSGWTLRNASTNVQGNFTWGNMYYMEQANYIFERAQFSVSKNGGGSMAGTAPAFVWVWEWLDANGDSAIQCRELNILAGGTKSFGAADTSNQPHWVTLKDVLDDKKDVKTSANAWYWVSVSVPEGTFLGCDGVSNYFMRSWSRVYASSKLTEAYSPMYNNDYNTLLGEDPAQLMQHFPFERFYVNVDSTLFTKQKNCYVPSVPVQMSLYPVGVEEVSEEASTGIISLYPNPASDVINVSVDVAGTASAVNYILMNNVGMQVNRVEHKNVTGTDKLTISTTELPSGQYYIGVDVDGKLEVKKFTILK
ncbi:MAG: T9SS type A sorting domain-containing protein [Chitinophagales bacterium]|nr:T9SS type A sorting domain-containing protein [Chitinophagaceae bacterium]MCB9064157.1 T9SS type A sorting domain-containing protein [Chitinophagales bacterium]